jgi:hypothetical protein
MWWHTRRPDFVFRRNGRVHLNRQGRQFSRLLAAEVCASAVVMLDTPCSEVVWEYWQPTAFASFPFNSPPVRHRVPSGFNWTLMLDTSRSETVWRVLAAHSIRKFPLHFPSRASPCAIRFQLDSNAGYATFRGSVKGTGYPLHSRVSPSLRLPASPCAITFQLDSTTQIGLISGCLVCVNKTFIFWGCHATWTYNYLPMWRENLSVQSNCVTSQKSEDLWTWILKNKWNPHRPLI